MSYNQIKKRFYPIDCPWQHKLVAENAPSNPKESRCRVFLRYTGKIEFKDSFGKIDCLENTDEVGQFGASVGLVEKPFDHFFIPPLFSIRPGEKGWARPGGYGKTRAEVGNGSIWLLYFLRGHIKLGIEGLKSLIWINYSAIGTILNLEFKLLDSHLIRNRRFRSPHAPELAVTPWGSGAGTRARSVERLGQVGNRFSDLTHRAKFREFRSRHGPQESRNTRWAERPECFSKEDLIPVKLRHFSSQ